MTPSLYKCVVFKPKLLYDYIIVISRNRFKTEFKAAARNLHFLIDLIKKHILIHFFVLFNTAVCRMHGNEQWGNVSIWCINSCNTSWWLQIWGACRTTSFLRLWDPSVLPQRSSIKIVLPSWLIWPDDRL